MKLHSSKIIMFILLGVLFLSVSSVYAETAEEYFQHGAVSCNQGDFSQAISDFTKAIEISPDFAVAYYNRGLAYFKQGNFSQASSDYNKAVEIDPNFKDAYYDHSGDIQTTKIEPNLADADNRRQAAYHQQVNLPQTTSDRAETNKSNS